MRQLWNKFLINFINGVVILLPAVATVVIVKFLVVQMNNIVLNPIMRTLELAGYAPEHHTFIAKTLVFFITMFAIAFIGWGARVIFIKRIFSIGERILLKVPIMGRVYNAAKQIFSAFLGHGKTAFKQVVLVEYPRRGMYSIGFTTGTAKGELKLSLDEEAVNVFVPTTPNPTSGMFIIIPKEEVRFLKMSVEDGMKLVISGGAVSLMNEAEGQ